MLRFADIWRCGIAYAPMAEIVAKASLDGVRIDWLPAGPPLTFLADPFGIWRDGQLNMFVESYDYRDKRGVIDVLRFDASFHLIDRSRCLEEPWHLSYPFIIEAEGEIWMLPEAYRSGRLTLYRAVDFPFRWEVAKAIELDAVAIDPTPFFFEGRWWLFYARAGSAADKVSQLHLAFADRLQGPWHVHPANPVRIDRSSARPGGTPIVIDDMIHAPMQDCRTTYGGAIRMLRIETLTPEFFAAEPGPPIRASHEFRPFDQGLHTISACGDVTLVDAKRFSGSPRRLLTELHWLTGIRR